MNRSAPGRMRRLAMVGVVGCLAGALTFGYLGWLHPAFDSFSHFRLHLAAALALCVPVLLVQRFRVEALFALAVAAVATFQTVGLPPTRAPAAARAEDGEAVYRLLHFNLRYDNPTPAAVLSLIGRLRPDVVTLNEVSDMWRERLKLVEAAYPYRLICPDPSPIGSAAILSRRPFTEGFEPYCADRGAFAHARIDMGGRPLEVATLHLGWPWPFEQHWRLPQLTPVLSAVGNTAIVAGDLNAAPWSHSARSVARDAGAELLRGIGPTWLDRRLPDWLRPLVGLPIDNVMVKGGIGSAVARTVEGVGSDHLPVLVEFRLAKPETTTVRTASSK